MVASTSAQPPFDPSRTYPGSMAGRRYPNGIPINPEDQLESLIRSQGVTDIFFSYSDVSYDYLMHRASMVGVERGDLPSPRPGGHDDQGEQAGDRDQSL